MKAPALTGFCCLLGIAMLAIGVGIGFDRDDGKTAASPPGAALSPAKPPIMSSPVPCGHPDNSQLCFPGLDTATAMKVLKDTGADCGVKSKSVPLSCHTGPNELDGADIDFGTSFDDPSKITGITVMGASRGPGDAPGSEKKAIKYLLLALERGFASLFPEAADFPAKITTRVMETLGRCKAIGWLSMIDGYEVGCTNPRSITVPDPAGRVTSWTAFARISAPQG